MSEHVQIIFWDMPASEPLEAAIHTELRRLRQAGYDVRRCRVSLDDVAGEAAGPRRTRARVEIADSLLASGWNVVVETRHERPANAVRAAFGAARTYFARKNRRPAVAYTLGLD
jgi:hypothetical protein